MYVGNGRRDTVLVALLVVDSLSERLFVYLLTYLPASHSFVFHTLEVRHILSQLRPDRQTFMFSATMSRRVERVAMEWLSPNALRVSVGRTGQASQNVTQHVMVLPSIAAKMAFLCELLPDLAHVGRTIVFVATRESCESLAAMLRSAHMVVDTLHGDKHQSDRTKALKAFSRGEIPILIATDVAARGLDVPQVATVLNYDPAKTLDAHVHRVGRAGRLSKDKDQQVGSAYTLLLTPKNADFAHILQNAFQREQREVSPELAALAQQSRKSGTVAARSHYNQSGLGFDRQDVSHKEDESPRAGLSFRPEQPPAKRSRWS
jgi:superfamily II DNA/RNA helicase